MFEENNRNFLPSPPFFLNQNVFNTIGFLGSSVSGLDFYSFAVISLNLTGSSFW